MAIVGGGPADLSCAWYLRRFGHEVTIFEARDWLGGMVRSAISAFQIPDLEIDRDVESIITMGVHVRIGTHWGRDFDLAGLLNQGFAAVFLAIGIAEQQSTILPGAEFSLDGLIFLEDLRVGRQTTIGGKALIIGGGRIAVETARCALRVGATEVTVVYPRAKTEMGTCQREIGEAEKEGVQFFMMAQPPRIVRQGEMIRVEMARTVLSEADARGRRQPLAMEGSSLWWEGDTVFMAPGQRSDGSFAKYGKVEARLALTPQWTIKSHPSSMQTNIAQIYAGGDLVSGPRSVIQAVSSGRRA